MVPIPSYQRLRIVADTVASGHRYFKSHSEYFDATFQRVRSDTTWLRYNLAGAVLAFSDVAADTASSETLTYWYHANFGDTVSVGTTLEIVGGAYDTTLSVGEPVLVAAAKTLNVRIFGDLKIVAKVYGADIGRVADSVFDGPETFLEYAKIGNTVYGSPAITVGRDREIDFPHAGGIHSLYPNPTRDRVIVVYDRVQAGTVLLEIYDMIGRKIMQSQVTTATIGTHEVPIDVSALSAGTYFVVLGNEQGRRQSHVLTVVK